MQYVQSRGNTYYFNRRAPSSLISGEVLALRDRTVSVGKNGYIRFSLQTRNKKDAKRAALEYAHLIDMAAARREATSKQPPPSQSPQPHRREFRLATNTDIEHAAQGMYAALLAADEQMAEQALEDALSDDGEIERAPDRDTWTLSDLPPNTTAGQAELIKMMAPMVNLYLENLTGSQAVSIGPELLPFAREFRRLVADLEKRRADARAVPTPSMPTHLTWAQVFEQYKKEAAGLAPGTIKIYRLAWDSLANLAGGTPAQLQRAQVLAWRDTKLYKDLSRQTAKNRFMAVSTIWHTARKSERIPLDTANPFEDIDIKVSKHVTSSRRLYSESELTRIFQSPPLRTEKTVSIHAGYWIPILALYYGARLEELTGIEVADIEETTTGLGIWIRPNNIRTIKRQNKGSRLLPIHPVIAQLGFEEYCSKIRESGVTQLFPSLADSQSFGEEFTAHVRKVLGEVEPGRLIGLHCLRHNWETAKRNAIPGLDQTASRYIAGRSIDEGSAAAYGVPAGQEKILYELSRIKYSLQFQPPPSVSVKELRQQEEDRLASMRAAKQRKATMTKSQRL